MSDLSANPNKPVVITDSIWIKAEPKRVFDAVSLGDQLKKWWPKDAQTEAKKGGKIVLHWFAPGKLVSTFDEFVPNEKVSFKFYTEHVTFVLKPQSGGTRITFIHKCTQQTSIHIAQCWAYLKATLKVYIEHGIDIRNEPISKE